MCQNSHDIVGPCHVTVKTYEPWKTEPAASQSHNSAFRVVRERRTVGRHRGVVKYFSLANKTTEGCTVCEKKVLHSSTKSDLFKHFKTTHPENFNEAKQNQEDVQVSKSPAPPVVRQKMLQESFQSGKAYSDTGSIVINYYLCQGSGSGNVCSESVCLP